jgi:hypothetical protein
MSDYYGRQFELFVSDRNTPLIAATNDRQFKITFEVLLDFGGYNTYADIAIYNVSRSTESKIFKKYEYVALRAGYESNIDYVFKGNIINILRERQGPNTVTRVICRGGALALDKSTINRTFDSGVTVPTMIKALADALGFPVVLNESDFSDESPYLSGYILSGDPKRLMNKLAKAHSFNWLIDNERILIVGSESYRSGPVTRVTAAAGMVGIPTITEVGADVMVKLNPALRIGGRFEIDSAFRQINFSNVYFQDVPETAGKGIYRIQKLSISGDSYGESWDTKITGIR